MKEFAKLAVDTAVFKGASYADIRIINTKTENYFLRNKSVSQLEKNNNLGFGIRVIADGAWGFAASAGLSKEEIQMTAARAVQIARASSLTKNKNLVLSSAGAHEDHWRTPVEIDPLKISSEEKLKVLYKTQEEMFKVKEVKVAESHLTIWYYDKYFASSSGSFIRQEIYHLGAGIKAEAVDADDMQTRSYPCTWGDCISGGYEKFLEMNLAENAYICAEEARALLKAPVCPEGKKTIIIGGSHLSLQIHESCGHPTELDRALGSEANYAGTSFMSIDKLNKLKYGSDLVTITADATYPGGAGTFGYDDEGVKAKKTYLIKDGSFTGYMMSRETSPVLGLESNGCMRADGWQNIPLVRMTNINLEPGDITLEDLIASTDDGLYIDTVKSFSIDDKRLNFQFGTEVAYEIKDGIKGKLYKNATYWGITPEFWGSCDAVADKNSFKVWGTANCGKGQPGQAMHTAQGCSPARFRNVQVKGYKI